MAMVTAKKGGKTITVSRSSYENIFKRLGYRDISTKERQSAGSFQNEEADENGVLIMEMNKEQLAEFAKKNNIDTSAARNVGEARKIVKREMAKRR